MKTRWSHALGSGTLLTIVALGCAPHRIYDPVALQQSPGTARIHVVVREEHDVAPSGFADALVGGLQGAAFAASVTDERQLTAAPLPKPTYLLTFDVDAYHVEPVYRLGGDPTAAVLLYSAGWLLVLPPAFIGLVREQTEQYMTVTVRLRDVSAAPLVPADDPNDSERLRFDVRTIPPSFQRSYRIELDEGRNWIRSEMGSDRRLKEHRRQIAAQYAARLLNQALPALIEALRRAPTGSATALTELPAPSPPAPPPAVPSATAPAPTTGAPPAPPPNVGAPAP